MRKKKTSKGVWIRRFGVAAWISDEQRGLTESSTCERFIWTAHMQNLFFRWMLIVVQKVIQDLVADVQRVAPGIKLMQIMPKLLRLQLFVGAPVAKQSGCYRWSWQWGAVCLLKGRNISVLLARGLLCSWRSSMAPKNFLCFYFCAPSNSHINSRCRRCWWKRHRHPIRRVFARYGW